MLAVNTSSKKVKKYIPMNNYAAKPAIDMFASEILSVGSQS
jgi:hypothetical protein